MSAAYRTRFTVKGKEDAMNFEHQDENDQYAKGLDLMGCQNIIKEFWQPHMQNWFRYHKDTS